MGEIASIRIGRTPPRNEPAYWTSDLERPFCSIADMTDATVTPTREGVTALAEEKGKAKRVPVGSLLLSFKLTIGRVGYAGIDLFPNEAIAWVEPTTPDIDRHYLGLWLGHQDLTAGSGRAVKGETLNTQSLRAICVDLPPVPEQRRIVDLIVAVDEAAARAQAEGVASQELVSALRTELIAESEAPRRKLADVLDGIDGGVSPVTDGRAPADGEPAVLKLSAVRPGRFRPDEAKALPSGIEMPETAIVRVGDVLITRSNTPDTVGFVCHVDRVRPKTYLSDLVLRLHPSPGLLPGYLAEALATDDARAQIVGSARGTSGSMRKISRATIREVEIPVPLAVQDQAAAVTLLAEAAKVRDRAQATAERLASLRATLLGDLLSGLHSLPESHDSFLDGAA